MKLSYTVREAAAELGLSEPMVRDAINRGLIKARKPSPQRITIPHAALVNYLEALPPVVEEEAS